MVTGDLIKTVIRLFACACVGTATVRAEIAPAQPNFVFIAVDDLNDYVSFLLDRPENFLRKIYPDPVARAALGQRLTPNLQRLADQSMVFTRAYCTSALCGPSRTAVLTGLPPHVSGYYQHRQHFRAIDSLRDAVTLPQYLRRHGYITLGIGKIYHGAARATGPDGGVIDWPDTLHSWSTYVERMIGPGGEGGTRAFSPYSPGGTSANKWENLFSFGRSDLDARRTYDFENAQFAANLLRRGRASIRDRDGNRIDLALPPEQPYFLACGLFAPHLPWVVPDEFYSRIPLEEMAIDDALVAWNEADIVDLPAEAVKDFIRDDWTVLRAKAEEVSGPGTMKHAWRAALQAYLASVAYADYCLGQLVDAIEESAERDRTVVLLWSDHGWNVGDKRRFRKHALWEGANHSVLMIRDPRVPATTGGARCDRNVSLQDIYPTILARAGLPRPKHVYGRDLTTLLERPDAPWDHPVLMSYNPGNHAVRTDEYSYIRYNGGGRELYSLPADPLEYSNISSDRDHAAKLEEMDQLLDRLLAQGPAD